MVTPETVVCIYRVQVGREDDFQVIMERHWPVLRELALVTHDRPQCFRGSEGDGKPLFIEIFDWSSNDASRSAHSHAEVAAIWDAMNRLTEGRDGRPNMEFPHAKRIDVYDSYKDDRSCRVPRLYRVILPVADIAKAVQFYGDLFQVPGERVSPGRHYFNLSGTILAVYDPIADGDGLDGGWKQHPNQFIYFGLRDLEAAFERAKQAGATMLSNQIESMPWGERLFYARDPFQNAICLVDDRTRFMGISATEASDSFAASAVSTKDSDN